MLKKAQTVGIAQSMPLSENFKVTLVWLVSGFIACFISLGWLSGAYIDGDYVPMSADSFYHAKRILDAVENLFAYYQYDPKMHVPEGSIITWPWFYDLLLAVVVKLALFFVDAKPIAILVYIPTIWVFANTALVIGIAERLELNIYLKLLCGLCFAFSPLTLALHGVGVIDHHYAELTVVLATLYAGIGWLKSPDSKSRAIVFGIVLGAGYGIHNGLFVLQIPFLVTLTVLWVNGRFPAELKIKIFSLSFAVTSLILIIPSLAFREGLFEFYTLSWFHLYITGCTVLFINFISRINYTAKNVIFAGLVSFLLIFPLLNEISEGFSFIGSEIEGYSRITETIGIIAMLSDPAWSFLRISSMYSFLIWLIPFTVILAIRKFTIIASLSLYELYFWIFGIFGLFFLLQQYRFHYFGSIFLFIPIILFLQELIHKGVIKNHKLYQSVLSLGLVVAYVPVPTILFAKQPLALDADHHFYRPLFQELGKECKKNPGVVLADSFDGHYISYYTECSVISNNFLISQQHINKYKEVNKLLSLNVADLLSEKTNIDYIFVRIFRHDQAVGHFAENDLRKELLKLNPVDNPRLRLVAESPYTAQIGSESVAVGRIYQFKK